MKQLSNLECRRAESLLKILFNPKLTCEPARVHTLLPNDSFFFGISRRLLDAISILVALILWFLLNIFFCARLYLLWPDVAEQMFSANVEFLRFSWFFAILALTLTLFNSFVFLMAGRHFMSRWKSDILALLNSSILDRHGSISKGVQQVKKAYNFLWRIASHENSARLFSNDRDDIYVSSSTLLHGAKETCQSSIYAFANEYHEMDRSTSVKDVGGKGQVVDLYKKKEIEELKNNICEKNNIYFSQLPTQCQIIRSYFNGFIPQKTYANKIQTEYYNYRTNVLSDIEQSLRETLSPEEVEVMNNAYNSYYYENNTKKDQRAVTYSHWTSQLQRGFESEKELRNSILGSFLGSKTERHRRDGEEGEERRGEEEIDYFQMDSLYSTMHQLITHPSKFAPHAFQYSPIPKLYALRNEENDNKIELQTLPEHESYEDLRYKGYDYFAEELSGDDERGDFGSNIAIIGDMLNENHLDQAFQEKADKRIERERGGRRGEEARRGEWRRGEERRGEEEKRGEERRGESAYYKELEECDNAVVELAMQPYTEYRRKKEERAKMSKREEKSLRANNKKASKKIVVDGEIEEMPGDMGELGEIDQEEELSIYESHILKEQCAFFSFEKFFLPGDFVQGSKKLYKENLFYGCHEPSPLLRNQQILIRIIELSLPVLARVKEFLAVKLFHPSHPLLSTDGAWTKDLLSSLAASEGALVDVVLSLMEEFLSSLQRVEETLPYFQEDGRYEEEEDRREERRGDKNGNKKEEKKGNKKGEERVEREETVTQEMKTLVDKNKLYEELQAKSIPIGEFFNSEKRERIEKRVFSLLPRSEESQMLLSLLFDGIERLHLLWIGADVLSFDDLGNPLVTNRQSALASLSALKKDYGTYVTLAELFIDNKEKFVKRYLKKYKDAFTSPPYLSSAVSLLPSSPLSPISPTSLSTYPLQAVVYHSVKKEIESAYWMDISSWERDENEGERAEQLETEEKGGSTAMLKESLSSLIGLAAVRDCVEIHGGVEKWKKKEEELFEYWKLFYRRNAFYFTDSPLSLLSSSNFAEYFTSLLAEHNVASLPLWQILHSLQSQHLPGKGEKEKKETEDSGKDAVLIQAYDILKQIAILWTAQRFSGGMGWVVLSTNFQNRHITLLENDIMEKKMREKREEQKKKETVGKKEEKKSGENKEERLNIQLQRKQTLFQQVLSSQPKNLKNLFPVQKIIGLKHHATEAFKLTTNAASKVAKAAGNAFFHKSNSPLLSRLSYLSSTLPHHVSQLLHHAPKETNLLYSLSLSLSSLLVDTQTAKTLIQKYIVLLRDVADMKTPVGTLLYRLMTLRWELNRYKELKCIRTMTMASRLKSVLGVEFENLSEPLLFHQWILDKTEFGESVRRFESLIHSSYVFRGELKELRRSLEETTFLVGENSQFQQVLEREKLLQATRRRRRVCALRIAGKLRLRGGGIGEKKLKLLDTIVREECDWRGEGKKIEEKRAEERDEEEEEVVGEERSIREFIRFVDRNHFDEDSEDEDRIFPYAEELYLVNYQPITLNAPILFSYVNDKENVEAETVDRIIREKVKTSAKFYAIRFQVLQGLSIEDEMNYIKSEQMARDYHRLVQFKKFEKKRKNNLRYLQQQAQREKAREEREKEERAREAAETGYYNLGEEGVQENGLEEEQLEEEYAERDIDEADEGEHEGEGNGVEEEREEYQEEYQEEEQEEEQEDEEEEGEGSEADEYISEGSEYEEQQMDEDRLEEEYEEEERDDVDDEDSEEDEDSDEDLLSSSSSADEEERSEDEESDDDREDDEFRADDFDGENIICFDTRITPIEDYIDDMDLIYQYDEVIMKPMPYVQRVVSTSPLDSYFEKRGIPEKFVNDFNVFYDYKYSNKYVLPSNLAYQSLYKIALKKHTLKEERGERGHDENDEEERPSIVDAEGQGKARESEVVVTLENPDALANNVSFEELVGRYENSLGQSIGVREYLAFCSIQNLDIDFLHMMKSENYFDSIAHSQNSYKLAVPFYNAVKKQMKKALWKSKVRVRRLRYKGKSSTSSSTCEYCKDREMYINMEELLGALEYIYGNISVGQSASIFSLDDYLCAAFLSLRNSRRYLSWLLLAFQHYKLKDKSGTCTCQAKHDVVYRGNVEESLGWGDTRELTKNRPEKRRDGKGEGKRVGRVEEKDDERREERKRIAYEKSQEETLEGKERLDEELSPQEIQEEIEKETTMQGLYDKVMGETNDALYWVNQAYIRWKQFRNNQYRELSRILIHNYSTVMKKSMNIIAVKEIEKTWHQRKKLPFYGFYDVNDITARAIQAAGDIVRQNILQVAQEAGYAFSNNSNLNSNEGKQELEASKEELSKTLELLEYHREEILHITDKYVKSFAGNNLPKENYTRVPSSRAFFVEHMRTMETLFDFVGDGGRLDYSRYAIIGKGRLLGNQCRSYVAYCMGYLQRGDSRWLRSNALWTTEGRDDVMVTQLKRKRRPRKEELEDIEEREEKEKEEEENGESKKRGETKMEWREKVYLYLEAYLPRFRAFLQRWLPQWMQPGFLIDQVSYRPGEYIHSSAKYAPLLLKNENATAASNTAGGKYGCPPRNTQSDSEGLLYEMYGVGEEGDNGERKEKGVNLDQGMDCGVRTPSLFRVRLKDLEKESQYLFELLNTGQMNKASFSFPMIREIKKKDTLRQIANEFFFHFKQSNKEISKNVFLVLYLLPLIFYILAQVVLTFFVWRLPNHYGKFIRLLTPHEFFDEPLQFFVSPGIQIVGVSAIIHLAAAFYFFFVSSEFFSLWMIKTMLRELSYLVSLKSSEILSHLWGEVCLMGTCLPEVFGILAMNSVSEGGDVGSMIRIQDTGATFVTDRKEDWGVDKDREKVLKKLQWKKSINKRKLESNGFQVVQNTAGTQGKALSEEKKREDMYVDQAEEEKRLMASLELRSINPDFKFSERQFENKVWDFRGVMRGQNTIGGAGEEKVIMDDVVANNGTLWSYQMSAHGDGEKIKYEWAPVGAYRTIQINELNEKKKMKKDIKIVAQMEKRLTVLLQKLASEETLLYQFLQGALYDLKIQASKQKTNNDTLLDLMEALKAEMVRVVKNHLSEKVGDILKQMRESGYYQKYSDKGFEALRRRKLSALNGLLKPLQTLIAGGLELKYSQAVTKVTVPPANGMIHRLFHEHSQKTDTPKIVYSVMAVIKKNLKI